MTWTQILASATAAAIVLWPAITALVSWLATAKPAGESAVRPLYGEAMSDLQNVRLRLVRTGCLDQDQKNAIDVLTLALVDGSDK